MPEILHLRAEPALYPMKSPFESAKRRSTVAENVRIVAVLSNGVTGEGEASPAAYVTGETPESVISGIPALSGRLRALPVEAVERWSAVLSDSEPTLHSGVEMALLDALARYWSIPLWVYFGGAIQEVRSDLTIPIAAPEEAGALASEAAGFGYRSLKIKVGGPDREADFRRVRAVAAAAPDSAVRLDANQGFAAKEALAFLDRCLEAGVRVELMEQPVHRDDWDALAAVTRSSPVPVFADEAVVNPQAAVRLAAMGAAHGINIKVAKAGLRGALQIIAIARAAGLRLMLGCMLESLVGIGAGLALACGTGAFDFLDLDSHRLIGLHADGTRFSQEGDLLRVNPTAAGLGGPPPPP
jgi:L-alanine-DL-glutamate epimerase-like enolase superfamily enzyme